ncbi:hypothetical protein MPER_09522, partial [Moniliophthora perniciosa FA553]
STLPPDYIIAPKEPIIHIHTKRRNNFREYMPEMFLPERYLNNEYGTKPGADVTENSLALNTMNFVWAFDFKPAKEDTTVDLVDHFFEKKGLVASTLPFECYIQPRNANVANIIEREYNEAIETFIKFERDLAPTDRQWVDNLRNNL